MHAFLHYDVLKQQLISFQNNYFLSFLKPSLYPMAKKMKPSGDKCYWEDDICARKRLIAQRPSQRSFFSPLVGRTSSCLEERIHWAVRTNWLAAERHIIWSSRVTGHRLLHHQTAPSEWPRAPGAPNKSNDGITQITITLSVVMAVRNSPAFADIARTYMLSWILLVGNV